MASTGVFTKRNQNQLRKVYPYVSKKPVEAFISSGGNIVIDAGDIDFGSSTSETFFFAENFTETPIVTVSSVDSNNTGTANVNVYLTEVTTEYCTVAVSNLFVGKVHVHAISIEET